MAPLTSKESKILSELYILKIHKINTIIDEQGIVGKAVYCLNKVILASEYKKEQKVFHRDPSKIHYPSHILASIYKNHQDTPYVL